MISSKLAGCLRFSGITFCSILFFACNFSTPRNVKNTSTILKPNGTLTLPIDSSLYKLAGGTVLKVMPGTSIGNIQLKMELDRSPVFKYFGQADSADAAMCKNWLMWYWKDSIGMQKEFDLYAVCDPDVDMNKTIQILRIKGVNFLTRTGISKASNIIDLKKAYPNISSFGAWHNPKGEKVLIWDDINAGIAFEYTDSTSGVSAVMIHQPGEKITTTYLPFYKKFK